jgi:hypothetical protein
VEQSAERAVHERGRLSELEVAHVALAQIRLHTRARRVHARLLEHRARDVDAHQRATRRQRDRNGDAAVADSQLDNRAVGGAGESGIERHILPHMRRPLLVPVCELVRPDAYRVVSAPPTTPKQNRVNSTQRAGRRALSRFKVIAASLGAGSRSRTSDVPNRTRLHARQEYLRLVGSERARQLTSEMIRRDRFDAAAAYCDFALERHNRRLTSCAVER